jgi:hypothetical protein
VQGVGEPHANAGLSLLSKPIRIAVAYDDGKLSLLTMGKIEIAE